MSDHSSAPRWPADAPDVDLSGRAYLIVSPGGCPVAAGWWARLADLGRLPQQVVLAELGAALDSATVGLRVMASGPEHLVLVAAAVCRDHGLGDDEVVLHATSSDERYVYCVHCKTTTLVRAPAGETAACVGCGRGLVVYEHLSRHSASYLGFQADAEETR